MAIKPFKTRNATANKLFKQAQIQKLAPGPFKIPLICHEFTKLPVIRHF